MADVDSSLKNWSTTASSNSPNDNTTIGAGLADNFQQLQATVRQDLASKGADIASAGTCDLGAVAGHQHDITGTTTITSFGTVSAGIWKIIKFEGVLTLTHNATSLILPGGVNITTADGDVAVMVSEGSGNWRCASYQPARVYGTYTPTLTAVTNVAASTAYACQYKRDGSIVTVSGIADIDPTAAGLLELGVSLPVASDFSSAIQCNGVANSQELAGNSGVVVADATNNRAQITCFPTDGTNRAWRFIFQYQVV